VALAEIALQECLLLAKRMVMFAFCLYYSTILPFSYYQDQLNAISKKPSRKSMLAEGIFQL